MAGALSLALLLVAATPARADPCGEVNLLAGLAPAAWTAVYRPQMATDGVLAREGDPANASLSTILGPKDAALVFDLQIDATVRAGLLQASAEATVLVDLSADQVHWVPLWQAVPVGSSEAGLRTRMVAGLDGHGRYLRVRPAPGQGAMALSELQLFCRRPPVLDVEVRSAVVAPEAAQLVRWQAWRKLLLGLLAVGCLLLLGPERSTRVQSLGCVLGSVAGLLAVHFTFGFVGTATLALLGLAVGRWVWRRVGRYSFLQGAGLVLLALAAPLAYTNFGSFAGYWSVHYHDAAHYFLGAKYAPELGYTRLYDCLATAAAQEQRWPTDARATVRDLRSNDVWPLSAVLKDGPLCTARFVPSRWSDFRRDVVFFQSQLHPGAWAALLTDHGYNATPAWTWLLRTVLLRDRPASLAWLATLSHLDDVGYGLLLLCLLWGFGARAGVLGALIIGLGFPWIALWTGGGLGRSLWLLAAVAGLGCLYRGRVRAAGAFLGLSAGLQVFPALLLAGPGLALAADSLRRRPSRVGSLPAPPAAYHRRAWEPSQGSHIIDRDRVRLLISALLTLALLFAVSCAGNGIGLWADFFHNSIKHAASTSTNRIGMGQPAAVFGWPGAVTWLLRVGFVSLWLAALLRQRTDADRGTLSVLLPPVVFNLSSYYLAILACLAPRLVRPMSAAAALIVLVLLPQLIVWLASDVPGPASYAAISLLFVLSGAAFLVGILRAR
ncbi:MAG: hypothetical protein ABSF35_12895 [Polyangia bacterium]|jgi:hypothetical protein